MWFLPQNWYRQDRYDVKNIGLSIGRVSSQFIYDQPFFPLSNWFTYFPSLHLVTSLLPNPIDNPLQNKCFGVQRQDKEKLINIFKFLLFTSQYCTYIAYHLRTENPIGIQFIASNTSVMIKEWGARRKWGMRRFGSYG